MRGLGMLLYIVGGIGSLGVDVLASIWLLTEHGIGWVILAWVTFVPLFIIPFLAGLAVPFIITLGLTLGGAALADR